MSPDAAGARERTKVPAEKLRWDCPEDCLKFETTDGVAPVEGTIGQDRALKALRVGLELYAPGYNIYVSGLTGTGRTSTVKELLNELSPRCATPRDRAFVMNAVDPDKPRLLTFPAGRAGAFRKELEEFVRHLETRLPAAFEEKEVNERREQIVKRFGEREQEVLKSFQEQLTSEGLTLVTVQTGGVPRPDIFPVHDGKPLPPPEFEKLVAEGQVSEEEVEALGRRIEEYRSELRDHLREGRNLARQMSEEIEKLNRDVGLAVIEGELDDLREKYGKNEAVRRFLEEVEKDVLDHLPLLAASDDGDEDGMPRMPGQLSPREKHLKRYSVNVVSDHDERPGCPVVVATNPTHTSLFGTIEREFEGPGVWRADHTMIKGGALLEADGGYLILNALDVLQQPGVWPFLMRTLKSGELEIRLPEVPFLGVTTGLKPEAIDLRVKVVLIGEPQYYNLLYRYDPDFRKIFKVKADFTPDMDLREENLEHYTKVIARICAKEDLPPLDRAAMGRLAEESVRAAGRQDRISTRFADAADVVREAAYWAGEDGAKVIGEAHVERAIREREYRSSLLDSRIQDLMEKDVLVIRTEGKAVGQVNGLSVYDLGFHAFGKPTLITATTSVGQAGIINIEREARLSGGIYDKGVLIISGYLRKLFARKRPLALTASLCFEQSYAGVDGDSASTAEIFALLSDLSGIPIDQGFAVTGSLNQRGEIQPIGGVNEKIEGFFGLCRARGLTGRQGVIIPRRNVEDLMLSDEVVAAVQKGEFHVHAISAVEEGIEILTGVPAGEPGEDGDYPEGSVFRAVEEQLAAYYEALRGNGKADWRPVQPLATVPAAPEPPMPPGLPPRPGSPERTPEE